MSTRPLFVREADARRNSRIRQANELVRSKQGLNTMQRRLFYIAMAAVHPSSESFAVTYLPEPLLRELLGGTYGSFKNDLEAAAHGLVGTTFRVRKEKGGWSVSSVFHRIEYIHPGEVSNSGETNYQPYDLISMQLHTDLVPYLIGLKGSYNSQVLKIVLELPIARSHKLYELLLHEGYAGKRREVILPIEDLKHYLEIDGEYEKFRDLRRVIDRCRNHIESVTDQRFSYEGVRKGRKISCVRFEVWYETSSQGTLPLVDTQYAIEEIQAASELIGAGYTQDAYAAVKTYGVSEIHAVVAEVRQAVKAGRNGAKPIYNPGGLVSTRLKERAQLGAVQTVLEKEGVLPLSTPEIDATRVAEGLFTRYEAYRRDEANRLWQSLDSNEQDTFLRAMIDRLDRFQKDLIKNSNMAGKGFEILRDKHLLREYGEKTFDLPDFALRDAELTGYPEEVRRNILRLAEAMLGDEASSANE
jgi:hypothetical protein